MSLRLLRSLLITVLIGCSSSHSTDSQSESEILVPQASDNIELQLDGQLYSFPAVTEFDRSIWKYEDAHYEANYLGVVAHYNSPGREDRLVYCIYLPVKVSLESFKLIETKDPRDGRWIEHGPEWTLHRDGGESTSSYAWGKLDGSSRSWYPNGILKQETMYVNGSREGQGRGYWADGSKQWEATYIGDVEISGDSWNQGEEF